MAKSVHHTVRESVQVQLSEGDSFKAQDHHMREFLVRRATTSDGTWVHLTGTAIKTDGTLGLINRNHKMKIEDLSVVYGGTGEALAEEFRNNWKGLADG